MTNLSKIKREKMLKYGLVWEEHSERVDEMLNKSSMFYDKISKIIFADYDIYCENQGLVIKVGE